MLSRLRILVVLPLIALFFLVSSAAVKAPSSSSQTSLKVIPDIKQRLAKFPQTVIDYDRNLLNAEQQKVVAKLIDASRYIDEIYWRQAAPDNEAVRKQLVQLAAKSPVYKEALEYFDLMKGRWDRLDGEPFISPFGKAGEKPATAGFYPADMTKAEFQDWVKAHPEERENFESLFTVIKRRDGKLVSVPYSEEYKEPLTAAAQRLREAAELTKDEPLKNFLLKRADAFLSNNYYDSDVAWVESHGPIEITIGPYEVYEDELFNMKASFESFVCVVDQPESEKLKMYTKHLPDMERQLPLPAEHLNPNRGTDSSIEVVQVIFTAGDARRGVQTAAFNLPNDEKLRQVKGSKNILLKNVMQAKFSQSGKPIALRVMDPTQVGLLSFDAYYNHTLFHELSHALGPGIITGPDGQKRENRIYLQDLYSTIEECKADVLGIWNLLYAINEKLITSFTPEQLFATDAGLMFRGMRFGIGEAHGGGSALEWNWYRENGAIVPTTKGHFKVDPAKYREAVKSLANELLMIEATGDYERAQRLLKKYAIETEEMKTMLPLLKDIPVDIAPIYAAAGEKKAP